MAEKDYIIMLRESLEQKVDLLTRLQARNKEQTEILKDPNSTPDELDDNVEKKARLIERITALDEGFEALFERVKEVLDKDRAQYADEIAKMQKLITKVSDLTADVEALEYRNKELAKAKFSQIRKDIREVKKSSAVVNNYYKSMMGNNAATEPQFMDRKK